MLSTGGRTKALALVHKIYFGTLSKTLVLKFNLLTEFFFQFKRTHISCTPCIQKNSFLQALNRICVNSRYIQVIEGAIKKTKITEQNSPTF